MQQLAAQAARGGAVHYVARRSARDQARRTLAAKHVAPPVGGLAPPEAAPAQRVAAVVGRQARDAVRHLRARARAASGQAKVRRAALRCLAPATKAFAGRLCTPPPPRGASQY